jgi:hypothetical protein
MAKDPAFPFYAQDYLVDTLRWTRAMQGLHVSLIAESWANGRLPDDNGSPMGLDAGDKSIWQKIAHKWELIDGFWVNEKLEKVRAARENFRQMQSERGKRSAGARSKLNTGSTEPQREYQPNLNQRSTVVEPIESEREKEKEIKKQKEPKKKNEIVYPFTSEKFTEAWSNWLDYRKDIKKPYRSALSEQTALRKLSNYPEETAIKMIDQSMENDWQGIFEIKITNGKSTSKTRPHRV